MRLHPAIPVALFAAFSSMAAAQDMRIGLQDDIDTFDPARGRTFVGEVVFESLCESLVEVGADLVVKPELAAEWAWNADNTELTLVLLPDLAFHDGSILDAEAVKANLERAMTMPESMRRTELQSIEAVEVTGDLSLVIRLSQPDPTLLPQLANRAGMMIAPASFETAGAAPVCTGPYRFVSHQQNYAITLEKFPEHRLADEYHFDRVIFMVMPDTTVRLANLRSGGLDMLERLAPSDIPAVRDDPSLTLAQITSVGYQGMTINLRDDAGSPLAADSRIRHALELAIDRDVINQVVGAGAFQPAQQPFSDASPFHDADIPVTARDVEAARALLAEAGQERVAFELLFANSTTSQQIAEMIQAMASEAGFDITLQAVEFTTMLSQTQAGDFDAVLTGWSGRYDPDGNIHQFLTCGAGLNFAGYCNAEVDEALDTAKVTADFDDRKALYDAAQAILQEEKPIIYLYHQPFPFVHRSDLTGFTPLPTGLVNLRGMTTDG